MFRVLISRAVAVRKRSAKGLSKNFSFWIVSLSLDAMFKIKSLLYKDLILNSRGCRKSNQLLRHPLVVEPCTRRYAFRTAKDVIVQECTSCTFLNFEFALQTRFFCEPLTSCQSSEFAACKLMFSGCHGWHPLNAAQDRSGILFIASMVQQQPST